MYVGSVCTQSSYNDKNPPSVFFFLLSTKIFIPFSNQAVCPCDVTQTEAPPTIIDWQKHFSTDCTGVLPQTRPEWAVIGELSRMTLKLLRCFVVGCNNKHRISHLLLSSEWLKRSMFCFERNAPSIYLNTFMIAQIICDPASSTEEVSTRFFLLIFANRLS